MQTWISQSHNRGDAMKKKCAHMLACIMIPLMVLSCRMVEVSSRPRAITIAVLADSQSKYQLSQLKVSGTFEPLAPVTPGIYSITIPAMDGGYSEFLFIKYNRHIPEEYPVIRIIKAGKVLSELSIKDLEMLPVKDGRILLKPE
jgi:hypothetical protein